MYHRRLLAATERVGDPPRTPAPGCFVGSLITDTDSNTSDHSEAMSEASAMSETGSAWLVVATPHRTASLTSTLPP
jgi:hypothetical protein